MWMFVLRKMMKQREAIIFIAMIVLSFVASSVTPYMNGKFIDLLTVSNNIQIIIKFAIVLIIIGILGAILSYIANLTTVKATTKTTMALILDGMDNILETDLVIAERFNFSYITQRLFQDASVITSFVLSNFLSVFLNGILVVGVLCCFYIINPVLCLIVVVVVIPYVVLFFSLRKPLLDSAEQKKEAETQHYGCISTIIEQVFHIQLNSRFSDAREEAQKSFSVLYPNILKAGRLSYFFSSIDSTIQVVFQSVLFIFAGIQIVMGNMTIGEFVMINSYFVLLLRAVKYYASIYKQYQDAFASYRRINEIMSCPKMSNGETGIEKINTVEVRNLEYGFSDQGKNVFSNANCIFHQGECYSVAGENGEGKSTLFRILAGLYGYGTSVLINNQLASDINLKNVRKNLLSCVPQKLYAPQMSVGDFIKYSLDVSPDELGLLLEKKNLQGYAQYIKDSLEHRCDTLSDGELRKLYIWVAAQKESDVLLLDEPTTDLDTQGQNELIKYIKENKRIQTIIVMTHDDRIMAITQHIIRVKNGELIYENDTAKRE